MQAITYTETGSASVLHLVSKTLPHPGPGEVRVRIIVSGVNPTDWKARSGATKSDNRNVQVPGQDGAGIVDAVGEGVSTLAPGARVWVWDAAWQRTEGTAQEYLALPERHVVPLPDGVSFDTGASLGIPALTAHRALTAHEGAPARLAPAALEGMTVLVAGGAGAVGHASIQLAAWAGARVIATVSNARKAELARRAGAHRVVNYRTDDVAGAVLAESPSGADIIVEVNPRANLGIDVNAVAKNGTIVVYASDDIETLPIPVRASMMKNIRFQFVLTYTTTAAQKDHAVRAVQHALHEGHLGVGEEHGLPLRRFPLEQTPAAHDLSESGALGKILIDVPAMERLQAP